MNKNFMFCIFFVSSCAQITVQDYRSAFNSLFQEKSEIKVNTEYIGNRNFSFAKVKIGNENPAILSLLTIENNLFTWISANGEKLITRNGKIIESFGLEHDFAVINPAGFKLDSSSNEMIIQLENPKAIITQNNKVDFAGEEQLFLDKKYEVELFIENFSSNPISWSGQNYYWKDVSSGLIIRTHQHVHPYEKSIELEFYYIFK